MMGLNHPGCLCSLLCLLTSVIWFRILLPGHVPKLKAADVFQQFYIDQHTNKSYNVIEKRDMKFNTNWQSYITHCQTIGRWQGNMERYTGIRRTTYEHQYARMNANVAIFETYRKLNTW